MPAAILIPSIIGAGASIGGALINRSAANNAQKEQQQATDQSLALQKGIYEQQRADQAPYRNVGASAVGTLGSLMGLPAGPSTESNAMSTMGGPRELFPGTVDPRARPADVPATGLAKPREQALGRLGTLSEMGQLDATKARTQSSVRIADDEGQEMDVPAALADTLIQRGARRVG